MYASLSRVSALRVPPGAMSGAECWVLVLCKTEAPGHPGGCSGCWVPSLSAAARPRCWVLGAGCPGAGVGGLSDRSELKYRDEEILLQTFIIIPVYLFGRL